MLAHAENECRHRDITVLELSTSELQEAALRLYRRNGFDLLSEAKAELPTNKTIGGGIRRYLFEKKL